MHESSVAVPIYPLSPINKFQQWDIREVKQWGQRQQQEGEKSQRFR